MLTAVEELRIRLGRLQRALVLAECVHAVRICACWAAGGRRVDDGRTRCGCGLIEVRPRPRLRVFGTALADTSWSFVVGLKSAEERVAVLQRIYAQQNESIHRFVVIKDACTLRAGVRNMSQRTRALS